MDQDTLLESLLSLYDDAVDDWLAQHCHHLSADTVAALRGGAEEAGYAGDLDEALRILDRAARVVRVLDDPLPMGLVWRGRASVLQRHDRFEESLAACREAAALYERHGTPFDVATARTVEVYVLGALERFDEAIELAHWIRAIFVQEDFLLGQAYLAYNLAQVYMSAWQLEEAFRENWLARRLFAQLGSADWTARVLHNLGITADQMDRLSLAKRLYTRAYGAFTAADDVFGVVKTRYNLALLCLRQGQYEEALAHLAQARADLGRLPAVPDAAYVDLFEARVRRALDQQAQARELLEKALATFEGEGRRIESAETLVELAHLQAEDTAFESLMQGVDYLKRAEGHLRDADVPLLVAWAQLEQAEFYLRLDCATEATECAEAAREIFAETGLDLRRAQAEALLADCRWQSQPDRAEGWYQSALDSAGEDAPLLAARCWRGLARLDAAAGDVDAAEEHYTRAVELLESVRRSLRGHSHQAGFLESWQELAEELLSALHARPGGEYRILGWGERLKARALADLLTGQPPDSHVDAELAHLLEQRERLRGELDRRVTSLRGEIGSQMQDAPQQGAALAAKDDYQAKSLSDTRRRLQALEEQIARRHDAAIEWREGATFDPIGVHGLLDEQTVLVSYYMAGGQLYALTATQAAGDLCVHPLCVSLADMEARWWRTRRLVARSAGRLADVQARLAYFWDTLIEPLVGLLRSKTRLLIVPHRGLFHIPFAGLYDTQNERYLVERWAVHLAPSVTALTQCKQRTSGTQRPLLVGFSGHPGQPDHLPGVETEIQALSGLFPEADVLFGEMATPQGILAAAPDRAFVHLAGHAFYDSLEPLESGMPLAGGRWLRASDLYLHYGHLGGATVVLSGCSTGRGRPTGGEVLGLTSAFLYAGAAGVVTSLWRVDDVATCELMYAFYRRLRAGLDTAEALRQAQLELLQSERYTSPYCWAPFELCGDRGLDSPIEDHSN